LKPFDGIDSLSDRWLLRLFSGMADPCSDSSS
jgi:hypothetical protein